MIDLKLKKTLFGANGAISLHIECQIPSGQLVTLYGPSGAGKTSIIRMVAGLMKPDSGLILANSQTWFDSQSNTNMPIQERNIGLVFQDYSLFPNMTLRKNLEYALPSGGSPKLIDEMLETIGMKQLQNQKPQLLSGGQKQRVALARAMLRDPKILLLDEPLSALDSTMRKKLQEDIRDFHKKYGLTTILVSHDYHEVCSLSDRVIWIEDGKIVKDGNPTEVLAAL